MSSRKNQTIKRTRPAGSNREALSRWGFIGQADRMPAYTSEHYAHDIAKGVADAPIVHYRRECPRHRPESDCFVDQEQHTAADGSTIKTPASYRSTWTHRRNAGHARIMTICFECRIAIEYHDKQKFFEQHGDHGLGYIRPCHAVREKWAELQRDGHVETADHTIAGYLEAYKAQENMFRADRESITAIEGSCPDFQTRYEQAIYLAGLRSRPAAAVISQDTRNGISVSPISAQL